MRKVIKAFHEGKSFHDFKSDQEVQAWKRGLRYPTLTRKVGTEHEILSCHNRDAVASMLRERGLSVAVRGYESGTAHNFWSVTTDNSIRADSKQVAYLQKIGYLAKNEDLVGMEIVSPPVGNFSEHYRMCDVLEKPYGNATTCLVNRTCSLHVHVDVTHNDHRERRRILRIYQHLSKYIHELIPDHRINNNTRGGLSYCELVHNKTYDELLNHDKYTELRINGRNRLQDGRSRTFEYRLHNATTSAWVIKCWCLILDSLHLFAENTTKWSESLTIYDVIESPLLLHFYNARVSYLKRKGLKELKAPKKAAKVKPPQYRTATYRRTVPLSRRSFGSIYLRNYPT